MALEVLDWTSRGIVESCHDISEGGMAIAALEMAFASGPAAGRGVRLDAGPDPVLLYSETPGYLLEVAPGNLPASLPAFASVAGEVTGEFALEGAGWRIDLGPIHSRWSDLLAGLVWREEL
jgi:phosphoribosylformylglycinamidine synthase